MADARADRRARTAAWLLTPASWCCLAASSLALLLAGPFALLLLPVAAPPLLLVLLQARHGTRLLRGDARAARPLLGTSAVAAVLLLAGALVALPGPTRTPPDPSALSRGALAGVLSLVVLGVVHALAAVLLWPAAARPAAGRSAPRLVGLALAVLAVVQLAALTVPAARG